MNICGSVLFVLANAASEKELANLRNAPTFLAGDLQQRSLDVTAHPESDSLFFR